MGEPEELPGGGPAPMVDAHIHLQDPCFAARLEPLVAGARDAGVAWLVSNASRPGDWETVAGHAASFPGIIPCFGIHPWFVAEAVDDWEERLAARLDALPSGMGEIGIDPLRDRRTLGRQEEVFIRQLDLAWRRELPATIHCAGTWGRLLEILRRSPRPARFLLHAYGGPAELAGPLADLGAWFSFGGAALLPSRPKMRRALTAIPPDRILLETDSPSGHGGRGMPAARHPDPADLPAVCRDLAAFLGRDEAEFRRQLWENARALFGGLIG